MSKGERLIGVGANVLDCDIEVSEFELQLRYYIHFQRNTLCKGMNFLIPHLWIIWYYCCSYSRIALDFNLSKVFDMP